MKLSVIFGLAAAGVFSSAIEQEQQQTHSAAPFRHPVSGPFNRDKTDERSTLAAQNIQSPWGGSVQEGRGWRTVTGTTVIPRVTNQSPNAGAAAWVGIDGYRCTSAILQTGVALYGDGRVDAWYEWWPLDPVYYGNRFPVKAGDTIRMSVNATSANSGSSTLENLTTGAHVTTPYNNMPYNLCGIDAEWIIEFGGDATRFANFGTWDITNTTASGPSGQVTANGGHITNVIANGHRYTNCGANSNGVRCIWQ